MSYESEACCDQLYIYDGTSASSTLIATLTGEEHDGDSFRSSGSAVLIEFRSDRLKKDGGFSLHFSDFMLDLTNDDTDTDMKNLTLKMPRNETFSIFQDQGMISSPGYPVTYPPSSFLTWEITSSPGTFIILEILNFNVQYGEELRVHDDSNGELLWKLRTVDVNMYSSYNYAGVYESTANKLLLSFSTLEKRVSLRGFNAYFYSKTQKSHHISLNADDTNWQTLTSPNFPENYGNNMNINWTISTTGDNVIRVEIETLNLEPVYDTLIIIDNNIPSEWKLIESVSGIGGEKLEYISHSNTVSLIFNSDDSISSSGFKINYKVYRVSKSMDETLEWQEGLVMNPDYPSNTYIYSDCYWLIRVNDGFHVNFIIDVFRSYDGTFTVYDGESKSNDILWSGTNALFTDGISFVSSSSDVFVSLNLRFSYSFKYAFRFNAVTSELSRNCFETLTSAPDVILSPYYPNYYPTGSDCQWLVQAPQQYTVSVYIDAISLGYYDSLDFYDGNSTDVVLAHCDIYNCSNGMYIGSYDSQMLIKMNSSDSDNSGNGFFKLKYTFCENSVCSETVMSPNYPNEYPNMYSEIYSIEVPSGVVYFEFKTFDTESCCDHLDIYDGNSVNSSLIVQLSGYREGFNGQTTGRFLTMMFTTDGSVTRSGFLMKYYNATIESNAVYYNLYQTDKYYYYNSQQKIILSPGYPGLYPNGVDYYWYFHGNANNYRIEFIVYKLDLDSSDFLKFYEFFGVDSTNLRHTLTGNGYHSDSSISIHNTRSTMWLYSDSTFSGEGFNIGYVYYRY
uniref:cubilin-like n=1 Tax=Styela clava TaxID=7725 RepID=UPI001939B949|nr:cubilin-like [Styela clava]